MMTSEQRLLWLRERQRGIGGSDAPALILSPEDYKWCRPADIWRSKVEPITDPDSPSLAAEIGTELEDFVARLFFMETGMRVRRTHKHYQHPEYPFMVGNIDRKVNGCKCGLECKTTNAYYDKKIIKGETPEEDHYPLHYYVQCQHYMAVTGWEKWYLAILVLNFRFEWFEIPRDDIFINDVLIPREREFWATVEAKNNIWEGL